jgi:hypothetical protein
MTSRRGGGEQPHTEECKRLPDGLQDVRKEIDGRDTA